MSKSYHCPVEGGKKGVLDTPKSTLVGREHVERPSFTEVRLRGLPIALLVPKLRFSDEADLNRLLVHTLTFSAITFGPRYVPGGLVVGNSVGSSCTCVERAAC